ncbi:protein arginine kinase [Pseudalkalibacillus salsuginis]|uniref:protein arginine kinase n=1 Tax=Pseudalkalibacillus salsuginis TaxID=2910972 RepID=UPI001EFFD66D|nr:protein arginine kinase [Pseudalkalibacillus salsuginis]MCF6411885.1 protein arginine kinase [Pseudalkalibacillus salsuginis]
MSLEKFISDAISPWMKREGPDSDIVLSSRIRLARNLENHVFPIISNEQQADKVNRQIRKHYENQTYGNVGVLSYIDIDDLKPIEKRVLVEKHLVSPNLTEDPKYSGVLMSDEEHVSIMINEEDHLRIQCLFPGFQLIEALTLASGIDDWFEEKLNYAFDEQHGYLTSCPTNVGTGMRASVMMHLPALVLTQKIHRIVPAINQLGLVVRGIYGEGSEAQGNVFQVSNQMTLGKSEQDIIEDLRGVVIQLIEEERSARKNLLESSRIQLEDRVYRSLGILSNSRIIQSKEATKCLSDVRLGIDLKLIEGISNTILNELMILTQPGFLQQYAGEALSPDERDIRRATLIRERVKLEKNNE